MDFRQFSYFVTTADELHYARAAERLGVSQPALSQQIKALEKQLGVQLFTRANRRIELTEAGTAFLQEARATLEMADRSIRIAQDTARGEAGTIDIGYVGSVMYEMRFARLLKAYCQQHPQVRLTLHERAILPQIEAVRQRQLDIAIVREPLPQPMPQDLSSSPCRASGWSWCFPSIMRWPKRHRSRYPSWPATTFSLFSTRRASVSDTRCSSFVTAPVSNRESRNAFQKSRR